MNFTTAAPVFPANELLNRLTWLGGREGASLFVAMDKPTYALFRAELVNELKLVHSGNPAALMACEEALTSEGDRTGLTKIQYMGHHICICDWVQGIAWAPYTADPQQASRAFVTGRWSA